MNKNKHAGYLQHRKRKRKARQSTKIHDDCAQLYPDHKYSEHQAVSTSMASLIGDNKEYKNQGIANYEARVNKDQINMKQE